MKIRVISPDGASYLGYVDEAPNQRDACLIACREVAGSMVPQGYTATIVDVYAKRPPEWPPQHWDAAE